MKSLTARCASVAAAALLSVSLLAVPALAAPEEAAAGDAVAAPTAPAEPTTYTVRLYAGNRGLVNDGACCEWSGVPYGSDLDFSGARVAVTDPKYYVKGIRLAGLDNVKDVRYVGQLDERNFASGTVRVTEDADYVLAYGIMANRVAYTVRYVDVDGYTVAPTDTFYGDVGDTPATAAVYVDGYVPNAYEITKTLTDEPDDNVITFTYTRVAPGYATAPGEDGTTNIVTPDGENVPARQPQQPAGEAGAPAVGEGAGDAAGEQADDAPVPLATAAGEELIGDDGNPLMAPRDSMSIDDDAVPMAARGGYGEGAEAPDGGLPLAASPLSIAFLAGGLILLVGALVLWLRRRRAVQED